MPLIDRFDDCRFCGGHGCAACPEEHRKSLAGIERPSMGTRPPCPSDMGPCYVCGEPARFLCDGEAIDRPDQGKRPSTCDRAMCDFHIGYHSEIALQKWAPGRGRYREYNSVDYCRDCVERIHRNEKGATHADPAS